MTPALTHPADQSAAALEERTNVTLTSHVPASGLERVFTIQHENYKPASGLSPLEAALQFIRTNRLAKSDLD